MSLRQYKTFAAPVTKNSSGPELIEVGDPLKLILRSEEHPKPTTTVYVAAVQKGGTRIGWDLSGNPTLAAATSSQIATADASDDTTGNALANALKTAYNAIQADAAAVFAAFAALGSPTSAQNATTAASDDATRLALANALRTNYAALKVDLDEIIANNDDLGNHVIEAIEAPVATDDTTTNDLLNELKDKLNLAQSLVSEAISETDTGYYQPRKEDVIGVDGSHQYNDPDVDEEEEDPLTGPVNPAA
jgi:hypothetical protein